MIISVNRKLSENITEQKREQKQMLEQEIAKQLISEANTKLSESLKKNDLAGSKVTQVMLSAGNVKFRRPLYKIASIGICVNTKV